MREARISRQFHAFRENERLHLPRCFPRHLEFPIYETSVVLGGEETGEGGGLTTIPLEMRAPCEFRGGWGQTLLPRPFPRSFPRRLERLNINNSAIISTFAQFGRSKGILVKVKMGSDFKSIPIIDIGPLLAKCNDPDMAGDIGFSEVVRQLDQACKEAGFFYVKGHGISDSLLKEVKDVTRRFFHLPYEEKVKIKLTAKTGYRGYQRIGENVTIGTPDMHEAIDGYREIKPGEYESLGEALEGSNIWPENPPIFNAMMEEYISLLTDLSRKIMRGIAVALGGSPYEFEGERAGDPFWVMRLIGYPGVSDSNSSGMLENDIGCGAHTDYGLLTLVNQDDDISALQVRNRSGEWIWAVPIPGTFVCNIGDMLKIWSNGLYESTLHRVINNSPKYRVSVAYFYEPNFDAVVKPFEFCKQKTGEVDKYERAVYGEHLVSKVTTNFAM